MVYVHKLGALCAVTALYAVCKGAGGVKRCEAGDITFYCLTSDFNAVPCGYASFGRGGYYVAYFSAFHKGDGVIVAFVDFINHFRIKVISAESFGSAFGGIELKSEVGKLLCNVADFVLVGVAHSYEYAAGFLHRISAAQKSLADCLLTGAGNSENLAG